MERMTWTYKQAGELLRAGKLVAFPTETVYGLGANALDRAAVLRIYEAKGRPATSPLIVHVATVAEARALAAEWPESAEQLATAFWPGPLTIVVKKISAIPDEVTAGLGTVGLRIPAHPVALELLREAGVPVAAPSANRFTELSPTRAEHVRQSLGDHVDLIVDGGACTVGIESTVVSVVGVVPILLRPGMISQAQLEAVLGPITLVSAVDDGAAHPAPGMHHKHYSPRTPLQLGIPTDCDCAYLWHTVTRPAEFSLRMPLDPAQYAKQLYEALHQLDAAGVPVIYVEPVPQNAAWAAIQDRLIRAAVK